MSVKTLINFATKHEYRTLMRFYAKKYAIVPHLCIKHKNRHDICFDF